MSDPEYYIEIRPKSRLGLNLKELVEYKELFYFFTWRDIKVKYKQTVLGFLWAILQPLFMMVIFTIFIGRALHVPSEGIPYPIFAFSGLLLWTSFSSGLMNAGNSMVSNASIIKKIYFPRLVIPVSSILVAVFDFFMGIVPLILLLIFYGHPTNWAAACLFWPIGLLLTVISAFGPGCLLAALNVKYRDFRYVIPFLIQALIFVTPVIYPISVIDNLWIKYVLALNPMYAPITIFRIPLVHLQLDYTLVIISLLSSVFFFLVGLFYFRRTEMYFADLA